MKCVIITEDCCRKISGQNSFYVILYIFRSEAQESVFWTANHYCLILPLKRGYSCLQHKHSFYLVLTLGNFLMIETFQRFHWHEQHMFKVDPNFSITHPSHLLSQILYKMKILN
jgi:hypothetical protein